MLKKSLTPEQAWSRIRHFCAYSERCHYDVREKLFGMGLVKKDVETILTRLIEEGHLNEERFARLFAGGHFRQKKWGRTKIVYALRQKRVSEANIRRAMKEIEDSDYLASLQKLASARWKALKHEQYLNRQAKTRAWLLSKGYEAPAIQQVINQLRSESKE